MEVEEESKRDEVVGWNERDWIGDEEVEIVSIEVVDCEDGELNEVMEGSEWIWIYEDKVLISWKSSKTDKS